MIVMKNILVSTDFSEPSDAALAYGREFARTFGARLHVLHVVEGTLAGYVMDAGYIGMPDLQKQIEEQSRAQLEALVTDDDRATLHAVTTLRSSVSPAVEVVAYAKEANIDLIVLGTHGRGTAARILLGSVADKVVRTAPCPVLTTHASGRDFLAPDMLMKVTQS